ncbi:MAG: Molybdopterin-synthase adenylyltransferase [uncultured Thermomicrobiales bacterium]|uniref:Molybdopterin-synthase adenylyltransferase n=1 Tax=uncultured Thermomicrobiales bacterium TaxID=1645740 RepID=A0A6J4UF50_9BACT|nr:MAG: Molybdopterin-synthase adenylyltransferase [uncultured Thermomicrobiales bacterium]
MPSFRDLLDQARSRISEVDVPTAQARIAAAAPAIIDVREGDEVEQGIIPGATHIPRGFLELRVEDVLPDKDRPVLVYCAGGTRSALAAKSLQDLGYHDVSSLVGGFNAWKDAGGAWSQPASLSPDQRRRYSRHLLIPEIGEAGQQRLLDARVLLIGAGGLGSPAALYLAAAGVGTLGIVDGDDVDDSNLQRQIVHTTDRIGRPKVESARDAIAALNPDVTVELHPTRLTKENARSLIERYDVVLDGSDNFATRYLVNDICVLLKKPYSHGSIFRFEGQATTFDPRVESAPCYRCLFPEPPPPELAPSCAEAGVLGVLPGMIGMIQATEVVKLVLGIGDPLIGRLLLYDALGMTFRTLKLSKDPHCPMCGPDAPGSIDAVTYTDVSCAIPAPGLATAGRA